MALPALQPAAFDVERLRAALPAPLAARVTRGRDLVRGRAAAPRATFPTSLAALDRLLDGGLQRAALRDADRGRASGRDTV